MLNPSFGLILFVLVIIIDVFLALAVYLSNPKSATNIIFALLTVFTMLWLLAGYLSVPGTPDLLLVNRLGIFFAAPQALLFFLLAHTMPSDKIQLSRWAFITSIVATLVVMALNISPYAFMSVNIVNGGVSPQAGPGIAPFSIISTLFSVLAIYWLIRKYRNSTGVVKKQFRLMLIGIFTMLIFIIATILVPIAVFHSTPLLWFGPLYTLAFLAAAAYAITRYQLFNIKVLLTQALTLVIWLILFAKIFGDQSEVAIVIDVLVFIFSVVFGILLIRSVRQEVKQRELSEKLAAQLKDLSDHLQQKVDEQTKEVKIAYEVERKARIDLEVLDKNKNQFILATQHHLRTPLTIIKGYLDSLIHTPPEKLAEQAQPMLQKADIATDRLSSLVNELLDISQMQVGKNILNKEELDLNSIIGEIVSDMQGEIEKKGIKISVEVETLKLKLDKTRIKEALTNLIDNAVKYCNDKGKITIRGEKIEDSFRLYIEDTGIGLTESEMSHAFIQYFERGEEAEKMNATGRGIGLAVTKNIIEAHGGKIHAESAGRNKGAKFIVELPLSG